MSSIRDIEASIQPLKEKLTTHSIYSKLNSKKNLLQFMSHHVYSVWDFMNLLKVVEKDIWTRKQSSDEKMIAR